MKNLYFKKITHKTYVFIYLFLLITSCTSKSYQNSLTIPNDPKNKEDYESKASKVMIASQGKYATEAGLKMYDLGGNIFDAFAAVSFVISVERPQSTGLGGGGFLVLRTPDKPQGEAWDFRESAPKRAYENMFLDKNGEIIQNLSLDGMKAVGVPGLVAGVLDIQKKYGRLPLNLIMAPAIELAKKGFAVYPHLHKAIIDRADVLKKYPASRKIFFHKDGSPLNVGDILIQKDLAKTLMKISSHGKDVFYKGEIADQILATSSRYGGILTQDDLEFYEVKKRLPLIGSFKDYKIITMPPPSSGGVHILQILNTLENDDLHSRDPLHPKNIHLVASSMQRAFADRAEFLGDSDFHDVPISKIMNKTYAKHLRSLIKEKRSTPMNEIKPGQFDFIESDDTTHFSIIDSDGNMIASTQTINGFFGSGVVAKGTGIVLNNEMDDFANKIGASNLFGAIGGKNNLVQPKKRPLSSMSPTLVLQNDKPLLSLGTPSGTRILTCVANVLLNYLEYKMPLYESVALTRYHHQWSPDEIRFDESFVPEDTITALKNMGYKINIKNLGCQIQATAFENNFLHGVSDPRGEGKASGR
jgi:gamma-glutamyltranspeptidase/glutathione hydrolase